MTTTQAVAADRFVCDGITIGVDVFTPPGSGRHPAAVVFYGTFGLLPRYRDDILSFGTALAAKGIVAFASPTAAWACWAFRSGATWRSASGWRRRPVSPPRALWTSSDR